MTRQEISTYINNAVLMNKLVTKEEAKDILDVDMPEDTLVKSELLSHLISSIQIDDAFFKKVENHIILVYFRPCYKKIDLKNSVDIIGDYAFFSNQIIEEVYGSTVIKIGHGGFFLCHNLKKVVFPNVHAVDETGFTSCDNLVYVVMKPRIIGRHAFRDCCKLRKFDFSNVEFIGFLCFANAGIERVIAPKLTHIEECAFSQCKLKMVYVPKLSVNKLISR